MKLRSITAGLLLPLCAFTFTSCDPFGTRKPVDPVVPIPEKVTGWAPIYSKDSSEKTVRSMDPRSIVKEGKIYIKGDTLYQVEVGTGIHVIDIRQLANPQKVAFISVVGAQEMAIKENTMYTNNMNDLVVIDITDTKNVKEVDRISNVFHIVSSTYPPGTGYYECVDPMKGTVVGWEEKTLTRPQCRN